MILKFALKTTRGMVQLGGAVVVGLLALTLGISSVTRYMEETTYRAAVSALARGQWTDARRDLNDLARGRPNDATLRVLLGSLALARVDEKEPQAALNEAASRFKEALDRDAARVSAAIGVAVAKLRLAEVSPVTERDPLFDEAARTLEQVTPGDSDLAADVAIARAGVAFARGNWKDAASLLEDAKSKGLPARASVGSYYWHKGLLAIANKDHAAVDDLRCAYMFRPGPEAARALALALRLSCSDATAAAPAPSKDAPGDGKDGDDGREESDTPKDDVKELDANGRAARARKIAEQRVLYVPGPKSYRYEFTDSDRGSIYNAIGIGLYNTNDLENAIKMFFRAVHTSRTEPLFRINKGQALLTLATAKGSTQHPYEDAAQEFEGAARLLESDAARGPLCQTLYLNAAILHQMGGQDPVKSEEMLDKAIKAGMPEKEAERHKGVLYDRGRNYGRAYEHYQKAMKLGHSDNFKMEVRIEYLKQKKGLRVK